MFSIHSSWSIELHINPGEYILWVSVALISTMIVLGITVLIFRRMEKVIFIKIFLIFMIRSWRTKRKEKNSHIDLTLMHFKKILFR